MSAKSLIEWTDATWNPVTGCTKVSAGCKNCYAETWAGRHMGEFSKDHSRKFGDVRCHPEKLDIPRRWREPRRIFVNSMSDLFHEDVPDQFIFDVWKTMMGCRRHTFQILTKRPARMAALCRDFNVFENVWLGVSVEDQRSADERIPELLATPAKVRFLSCEPLLGPVDLSLFKTKKGWTGHPLRVNETFQPGIHSGICGPIRWVICGGESGPGARPMHPDWARSLRDQCHAAGVPFFFKQWGEFLPDSMVALKGQPKQHCRIHLDGRPGNVLERSDGTEACGGRLMFRVGKKTAGRLLDGREWNDFP